MPEFSIFTLGLILLTASLVAMVSRRFKLPYSVGLVIAGIVLALLPSAVEFPLTRDLIFNFSCRRLFLRQRFNSNGKHFAAICL